MTYMRRLIFVLTLWLAALQGALANPLFNLKEGPLKPEQAFQYRALPDQHGGLRIEWQIARGYYLYRDQLAVTDAAGTPLQIISPKGEMIEDLTFGTTEVYPWDVTIELPHPASDMTLKWQGCQEEGICYAPQQATIKAANILGTDAAPDTPPPLNKVEALQQQGGTGWVLLGFMGLGLLLAFTPCTFPMLPILWTVLRGAETSRSKSFGLASSYILGMAFGFAAIGAVAGWTGASLQFALQSPIFLVIGAAVFLLLAAASLDVFALRLPRALTDRMNRRAAGGSLFGAAVLGLGSVLLIGPCVTAPLAGALLYIAQSGDVALGAAALGMLGLGQGLPLMALALFGRQILPKGGPWLNASRVISATLMAGVAIWLLSRILPDGMGLALWALLAFALAAQLSGLGFWRRFGSHIAFAMGLLYLFGAALGANDPLRPLDAWRQNSPPAASTALRVTDLDSYQTALKQVADRPVVVYFTADWCVICRGLERDVFQNSDVLAALEKVAFIKADVTDFNGKGGALAQSLGVIGPPTLLFLDQRQQERQNLRLTGAFSAADFLTQIEKLSHD